MKTFGARLLSSSRVTRLGLIACSLLVAPAPNALADEPTELRTWTDSTGKFKIEARLIGVEDGKVSLERKDGKEMQIALKKLSAADREYLAELEKGNPFEAVEDSPFEPKAAPGSGERKAKSVSSDGQLVVPDWSGAQLVSLAPTQSEWKFTPVPTKAAAPLKNRPIAIPKKSNFFEATKTLAINAASQRAAIGYILGDPKPAGQTRLVLCDLEKGRSVAEATTSGQLAPLALADDGGRVLMRREEWGGGNQDRLEVWTISSSGIDKGIKWIPYDDLTGGDRDVKWAEFIDAERVATISGSGKLAVWNLTEAKPLYSLQVQGGSIPALSPDRKWIAFATDKQIGVLDVDAAEVLAIKDAAPNMAWPVLVFSPEASRLACVAFDRLYVWDFSSGELYREIPFMGLHVMGQVLWPSENHVLLGNRYLLDLENQVKLWDYQGHELVQYSGGVCWFAVSEGEARPGALVPIRIPQPGVEDALKKAMAAPDFFVLKPGTSVKVQVNGIEDPTQRAAVQASLEKRLAASGLKADPAGGIELQASTALGEDRDVTYQSFGFGFGSKTYKVKEHLSRVKFVYQGQSAWEWTSNNIPGFIQLKEGEKVEDVLKQHEKPNYGFFDFVELPKLLTKPNGATTLGASKVGVAGLQ